MLAAVKHCGDRVVISCAKRCFHNWSSTAFCPCYSSVCRTPIFVCGSSPSRSQWAFLSSACLAVSLLWLRNLYLLVNNNFLLLMIEECCQRNNLWTVAFCVWTSPLGPPLLHSHFPCIFCSCGEDGRSKTNTDIHSQDPCEFTSKEHFSLLDQRNKETCSCY